MGVGPLAIRGLDFEAEATVDPAVFALAGSADARSVGDLTTLIDSLHTELLAASVRQVVVDLRRLEFMNASCFNVIVAWIGTVNELAPNQRYKLQFTTNPAIPWQRRSLRTLSCFATDLVVLA